MRATARRCTEPGCVEPHNAKGLCRRHYEQARYWADPARHRARRRARYWADPDTARARRRARYADDKAGGEAA